LPNNEVKEAVRVAAAAPAAAVGVAAAVAEAAAAAGPVPAPGDFASARPAGTVSPTSRAPRVLT